MYCSFGAIEFIGIKSGFFNVSKVQITKSLGYEFHNISTFILSIQFRYQSMLGE